MKKNHETHAQPARAETEEAGADQLLPEAPAIDGVGPPKKADFGSMPSPIRYFGYFFFVSATLVLIVGLWMQFQK